MHMMIRYNHIGRHKHVHMYTYNTPYNANNGSGKHWQIPLKTKDCKNNIGNLAPLANKQTVLTKYLGRYKH